MKSVLQNSPLSKDSFPLCANTDTGIILPMIHAQNEIRIL